MSSLGNFLRLHPLHINEIPYHPSLSSIVDRSKGKDASTGTATPTNVTRPRLRQFVSHVLREAYNYTQHELPKFASKGFRKSPPSYNKVELLTNSYPRAEIQQVIWQNPHVPRQWSGHGAKHAEHWYARKSRHANHSEYGTATFSEFDYGSRQSHPEHEMAYTPQVYDCFDVLDWNEEIQRDLGETRSIQAPVGEFSEVRMSVREMCHKLPFPCNPRVFPVLVVTAKGPRKHNFIVAQIPIDISNLTAALYSNDRNKTGGRTRLKKRKTVKGAYASVEFGQILPDQNIQWLMATTSDAKGWLPMWMQQLGVPDAIVKDVGLFMKWIARERSNRRKNMLSSSRVSKEDVNSA